MKKKLGGQHGGVSRWESQRVLISKSHPSFDEDLPVKSLSVLVAGNVLFVLWCSFCFPFGVHLVSLGCSLVSVWCSFSFPLMFLWLSFDAPLISLWFPYDLVCFPSGLAFVFLKCSFGFPGCPCYIWSSFSFLLL